MIENKKSLNPKQSTRPLGNSNDNFVLIDEEPITGDRQSIYKRLFEVLSKQIKIASDNYENFNKMGDLANSSK